MKCSLPSGWAFSLWRGQNQSVQFSKRSFALFISNYFGLLIFVKVSFSPARSLSWCISKHFAFSKRAFVQIGVALRLFLCQFFIFLRTKVLWGLVDFPIKFSTFGCTTELHLYSFIFRLDRRLSSSAATLMLWQLQWLLDDRVPAMCRKLLLVLAAFAFSITAKYRFQKYWDVPTPLFSRYPQLIFLVLM